MYFKTIRSGTKCLTIFTYTYLLGDLITNILVQTPIFQYIIQTSVLVQTPVFHFKIIVGNIDGSPTIHGCWPW